MLAGECSLFKMIAESQGLLGVQIHNAEIPRGSTCLLTQAKMCTFFPTYMHSDTQYAGPVEAAAVRCRVGPLLG